MRRFVIAAALLFGIPGTALADEGVENTRGLYGALDVGYHNPDGTVYGGNLQGGFAFNLRGGYRFDRWFALETGIFEGLSRRKGAGSSDLSAVAEIVTLDGRFYPLRPGRFEPNLLLGYTVAAGASSKSGSATQTLAGHSTNLGLGVRVNLDRHFFVDADYRHMFMRFTRVRYSGFGPGIDGTFKTPKEYHGDDDAFLFGGGLQF